MADQNDFYTAKLLPEDVGDLGGKLEWKNKNRLTPPPRNGDWENVVLLEKESRPGEVTEIAVDSNVSVNTWLHF